jgi:Trk-type K+ transport system membrane component
MAGGIRVARIIDFAKSVKENIRSILTREKVISEELDPFKKGNSNGKLESLSAPVIIVLFTLILVIFSLIFTSLGVSFTDSLFEVGSALTTNGISMGATNVSMPIGYKWLMIATMTIGRVEILSILVAIGTFGSKQLGGAGLKWLKRVRKQRSK